MSARGSIETRIVKYFRECELDMAEVLIEALGRIVAGRKRDAKAGTQKVRKPRAARQVNTAPTSDSEDTHRG